MLFPPGLNVISCLSILDVAKTCLITSSSVFYQELVSISTEGRTGYLSVLGNVKHKIVCFPDFEALLEGSA